MFNVLKITATYFGEPLKMLENINEFERNESININFVRTYFRSSLHLAFIPQETRPEKKRDGRGDLIFGQTKKKRRDGTKSIQTVSRIKRL